MRKDRPNFRQRLALQLDAKPFLSTTYFQTARALNAARTASPRLVSCLLERRLPEPTELRDMFESLGVTYVKLGQFIGSAPSLFPKEYVDAFQDCFDRTEPIEFSVVKAVIEQELQMPLEHAFARIDPEPLATASIAQVHTATLHSGESVVVKVQKPGVSSTIKADLNVILLVTRVLEKLSPQINSGMLSGFVEAIYPYMNDECDFTKEAQYLMEFRRYLQETGKQNVVVPKPFAEKSTAKVLTMQRLHGKNFSDVVRESSVEDLQASQVFSNAVAAAKSTWFDSLSGNWFFHADLHLGNIMLLDDGTVGFVDFGLVGSIPEKTWEASMKLFQGLLALDSSTIANSLVTIGMTNAPVDINSFEQDIRLLLDVFNDDKKSEAPNFSSSPFTQSAESVAEEANRWMMGLATISRDYGIVFPHAFTLLLKQFLYFDRLGQYSTVETSILDHMDIIFEDLEQELLVLE